MKEERKIEIKKSIKMFEIRSSIYNDIDSHVASIMVGNKFDYVNYLIDVIYKLSSDKVLIDEIDDILRNILNVSETEFMRAAVMVEKMMQNNDMFTSYDVYNELKLSASWCNLRLNHSRML